MTCSAVAKASLLLISSIGPPASDIAADESGDVGVRGSWYMAAEAISDSPIMKGDLGGFDLCDGEWGLRLGLGLGIRKHSDAFPCQNIIVNP